LIAKRRKGSAVNCLRKQNGPNPEKGKLGEDKDLTIFVEHQCGQGKRSNQGGRENHKYLGLSALMETTKLKKLGHDTKF